MMLYRHQRITVEMELSWYSHEGISTYMAIKIKGHSSPHHSNLSALNFSVVDDMLAGIIRLIVVDRFWVNMHTSISLCVKLGWPENKIIQIAISATIQNIEHIVSLSVSLPPTILIIQDL